MDDWWVEAAGWTREDWTGMDWTGVDWTGVDWTGVDWTEGGVAGVGVDASSISADGWPSRCARALRRLAMYRFFSSGVFFTHLMLFLM